MYCVPESKRRLPRPRGDLASQVGSFWPISICPGLTVFAMYIRIGKDVYKTYNDMGWVEAGEDLTMI